MSKCNIKGCRKKANISFQTRRFGTFQDIGLCWSHGTAMSRKEIFADMLEKEEPKKKYKTINAPEKVVNNKDTLTLDNYLEVTGKRFRMTKDQKSRGISRDEAFAEFMDSVGV